MRCVRTPSDLDRVFKAYDVRGVVPDDLDDELVRRIGQAFADWSGAETILVGRDVLWPAGSASGTLTSPCLTPTEAVPTAAPATSSRSRWR